MLDWAGGGVWSPVGRGPALPRGAANSSSAQVRAVIGLNVDGYKHGILDAPGRRRPLDVPVKEEYPEVGGGGRPT